MNTIKRLSAIYYSTMLILITSTPALSLPQLNPRIQIGLNLLPAVIAANKKLADKDQQKSLSIFLLYNKDRQIALQAEQNINTNQKIRGHSFDTEVISINQLMSRNIDQHDAIFIVEKIQSLEALIAYSREQQVILFSPFEGDIEKGVMSGIAISNNVLPAINQTAVRRASLNFKAFFLRIAVKYD